MLDLMGDLADTLATALDEAQVAANELWAVLYASRQDPNLRAP